MSSYNEGKKDIVDFLTRNFSNGATVLDVGCCDGKWVDLLDNYFVIDGVEAFKPNVVQNKLLDKYRNLFIGDIKDYRYDWYDIIIFGDVIEHLSIRDAQEVLKYAYFRSREIIIGIPFQYPQGIIYGNPYEVHIQSDLTKNIFDKRYPAYEILIQPRNNYAYYHKAKEFK